MAAAKLGPQSLANAEPHSVDTHPVASGTPPVSSGTPPVSSGTPPSAVQAGAARVLTGTGSEIPRVFVTPVEGGEPELIHSHSLRRRISDLLRTPSSLQGRSNSHQPKKLFHPHTPTSTSSPPVSCGGKRSYTITYKIPADLKPSGATHPTHPHIHKVEGPMLAKVKPGDILQVGAPGDCNKVTVTVTDHQGKTSVKQSIIKGPVNIGVAW